MQMAAENDRFRRIFFGDPAIGGRYSVLSNFGMVPAAAMGLDLSQFLRSAALMVRACAAGTPPLQNPGVQLGAVIGVGATTGRDKVTIVASPGIADVGAWLEQLLAESTGKQGRGIVPVDNEPLADASHYGDDRVFAYLRLKGGFDPAQEEAVAALEQAGQPVVRVELANTLQLGQAFFLWEFATAVAGAIIGIDAFDQPDVEASKVVTKKLTAAYNESGKLPDETPFLTDGAIQLFSDERNAAELSRGGQHAGRGDEGASGPARGRRLRSADRLYPAHARDHRGAADAAHDNSRRKARGDGCGVRATLPALHRPDLQGRPEQRRVHPDYVAGRGGPAGARREIHLQRL